MIEFINQQPRRIKVLITIKDLGVEVSPEEAGSWPPEIMFI